LENKVRWAGKSSLNSDLESFVAKDGVIGNIVEDILRIGATPIFEWCEAGMAVGVIRHEESRLVLIAVRDNTTGQSWERQSTSARASSSDSNVPTRQSK